MQYKSKRDSCQVKVETPSQLTVRDVCRILRVTRNWLKTHRDELEWYTIPGWGRTGISYRFTRESVDRYIRERIRV